MARTAINKPMKAYDHVVKLLKDAGGDAVISRADARKLVKQLRAEGRGTEALAAANIFKMIDKRDNEAGHRVTGYDLKEDRAYVQQKLLENRDINRNGISRAEEEKMSPTGRALMELCRALALEHARGRIPYSTPEAGLFHVAAMIREAAQADLITSRGDIDLYCDKLYKQGRGNEMLAVQTFFGFMDHRDAAPGARITDEDIDKNLVYGVEKLLRGHDLNANGYSHAEYETFGRSARGFFLIGQMIENGALKSKAAETGVQTQRSLRPLVRELEFDQLASEGGQPVKTVLREGRHDKLDRTAFRKAFKLPDDGKPEHKLAVFRKATAQDLKQFIEVNRFTYKNGRRVEDKARKADLYAAVTLLRDLDDLKVVVKGADGLTPPQHAAYIVGLARDGSMVGIQSSVIWT